MKIIFKKKTKYKRQHYLNQINSEDLLFLNIEFLKKSQKICSEIKLFDYLKYNIRTIQKLYHLDSEYKTIESMLNNLIGHFKYEKPGKYFFNKVKKALYYEENIKFYNNYLKLLKKCGIDEEEDRQNILSSFIIGFTLIGIGLIRGIGNNNKLQLTIRIIKTL